MPVWQEEPDAAQRLGNRREIGVGIVDEEIFGKITVALRGVFVTAEHAATLRSETALAVFAVSTGGNCADRDPVTFFTAGDIFTDFIHDANAFVPQTAATGNFNDAAHRVHIRGANERRRSFDHGIIRAGIGNRLFDNPDFTHFKKYQCFHVDLLFYAAFSHDGQ